MPIIYCNIQLFSCDQMIYVIDEQGDQVYAQKVDIEDLAEAIGALATERAINKVKISGSQVYTMAWAEQIQSAYALKYGKNDLEIEVL